jgi:hypothetical protein
MTDRSQPPSRNESPGCEEVIALRSAPAQKAPPAPVRMQTRMESSLSTRSQASRMMASISGDSALRASGRFIVTMRTWHRCSTSASGIDGSFVSRPSLAPNDNTF